jgi:uncharacterized membrane protein YphA (DoxX/SURF4 family)
MNQKWVGFLRIIVGIFFLSQGINKLDWFTSSDFLKMSLDRYALNAHPVTIWYQDHIAKPGVEAWARLIPAGEMAIGIGLILGLLVRPTLITASLLVINYYITNGNLFSLKFFVDPYTMLLLSCLMLLLFNNAGAVFALENRTGKHKKISAKPSA